MKTKCPNCRSHFRITISDNRQIEDRRISMDRSMYFSKGGKAGYYKDFSCDIQKDRRKKERGKNES